MSSNSYKHFISYTKMKNYTGIIWDLYNVCFWTLCYKLLPQTWKKESLGINLLKTVSFLSKTNAYTLYHWYTLSPKCAAWMYIHFCKHPLSPLIKWEIKQAAFSEFRVTYFLLIIDTQHQSRGLGMSLNEK